MCLPRVARCLHTTNHCQNSRVPYLRHATKVFTPRRRMLRRNAGACVPHSRCRLRPLQLAAPAPSPRCFPLLVPLLRRPRQLRQFAAASAATAAARVRLPRVAGWVPHGKDAQYRSRLRRQRVGQVQPLPPAPAQRSAATEGETNSHTSRADRAGHTGRVSLPR
jgi:hypothetical protein